MCGCKTDGRFDGCGFFGNLRQTVGRPHAELCIYPDYNVINNIIMINKKKIDIFANLIM